MVLDGAQRLDQSQLELGGNRPWLHGAQDPRPVACDGKGCSTPHRPVVVVQCREEQGNRRGCTDRTQGSYRSHPNRRILVLGNLAESRGGTAGVANLRYALFLRREPLFQR